MSAEQAAFIIVYLVLVTVAIGGFSAAPWVPTRKRDRQRIAEAVPLRPGDVVYDLGCGDGTVLFELARRTPGIRAIGFEISPPPFLMALARKAFARGGAKDVSIRCRDFFEQPLGDADVVFIFLFRKAYPRLVAKLARELKDDALVVVEAWALPGIEPERSIARDELRLPIHFYRGRQLRAART